MLYGNYIYSLWCYKKMNSGSWRKREWRHPRSVNMQKDVLNDFIVRRRVKW